MKRYVALGAVLTALGAAGAAAVQGVAAGGSAAQTKDGGLSLMPALIEHNAQPGQLASMTVANRSTAPLDVTVTPRRGCRRSRASCPRTGARRSPASASA